MRRRLPRGRHLLSWLMLASSGVTAGLSARRAIVTDSEPVPVLLSAPATEPSGDTAASLETETYAIELPDDPFDPERRVPGAHGSETSPPDDDRIPASTVSVRLLGTVVRPGGGFVLCQLASEAPRIVHVGERLGDLTLVSLEQGRAIFAAADGARLELSLSKPGG